MNKNEPPLATPEPPGHEDLPVGTDAPERIPVVLPAPKQEDEVIAANAVKPKLLVIDDDDEICTQMKWALSAEYEVILAGDRTAAMAAFQEHRPSVVLLDLGLPPCPSTAVEGF